MKRNKKILLLLGGVLGLLLFYGAWQSFSTVVNNERIIIILNGIGSSGKSTIIREMQKLFDKPLLHTGLDNFWEMVPAVYKGYGAKSHEGFSFIQAVDVFKNPVVYIERGSLAQQIDYTMPQIIKCLADCGHDVAIDEILISDAILHNYALALKNYKVYFVGVVCDLQELERREKARGDRIIGLARGQIDFVHKHKKYYDLVVDSTNSDPAANAKIIFDYIRTNSYPQGLKGFSRNKQSNK
jgi:chloramphenicol 3-O phosphotransferase